MKPFLLFFWRRHDPRGGWHDFQGSFDTLAEASQSIDDLECWQIVHLGVVVDESGYAAPMKAIDGETPAARLPNQPKSP